jgi:hypothetical protein
MRWRLVWAAASSSAAFLAACGGTARQAAPPPRIPATIAAPLAARADALAAALERGDACAARSGMSELEGMADQARLSAAFRDRLLKAVRELATSLPECAPPPPPPHPPPAPASAPPPAKDHGKKHGHEKGGHGHKRKGHGGGD